MDVFVLPIVCGGFGPFFRKAFLWSQVRKADLQRGVRTWPECG